MSRYAAMFERLRARGEGAFGAFVMLGDPDPPASGRVLDALVDGGADMIEVGIPFSDLIANFRARHPQVPVGILTYANLVLAPGRRDFFLRAAEAGADSLLVADLPLIEAEPWTREMRHAELDPVLIAAGNTPDAALRKIAGLSGGYTYCVTRPGITGTHTQARFDPALIDRLRHLGRARSHLGLTVARALGDHGCRTGDARRRGVAHRHRARA